MPRPPPLFLFYCRLVSLPPFPKLLYIPCFSFVVCKGEKETGGKDAAIKFHCCYNNKKRNNAKDVFFLSLLQVFFTGGLLLTRGAAGYMGHKGKGKRRKTGGISWAAFLVVTLYGKYREKKIHKVLVRPIENG